MHPHAHAFEQNALGSLTRLLDRFQTRAHTTQFKEALWLDCIARLGLPFTTCVGKVPVDNMSMFF